MVVECDPVRVTRFYKEKEVFTFDPIADRMIEDLFGFPCQKLLEESSFTEKDFQYKKSPVPYHQTVYAMFKQYPTHLQGSPLLLLTNRAIRVAAKTLRDKYTNQQDKSWVSCDLSVLSSEMVFDPTNTALFGDGFPTASNSTIVQDFNLWDQGLVKLRQAIPRKLKYWISAPAIQAREKIQEIVHRVSTNPLPNESSLIKARRELCLVPGPIVSSPQLGAPRTFASLTSTAMIWVSNANTVPAVFWAVFFVCWDAIAYKAVQQEIDAFFAHPKRAAVTLDDLATGTSSFASLIYDAVDDDKKKQAAAADGAPAQTVLPGESLSSIPWLSSFPILDSALNESLRLTSSSISARRVLQPTKWPLSTNKPKQSNGDGNDDSKNNGSQEDEEEKYIELKKGEDFTVMSWAVHFNESIYEDPYTFKYDRFVGNGRRLPLLVFGGGAHMCPGRHYARGEMIAVMVMLMRFFEMELAEEHRKQVPPLNFARFGLGTLPSLTPVTLRLRPRAL